MLIDVLRIHPPQLAGSADAPGGVHLEGGRAICTNELSFMSLMLPVPLHSAHIEHHSPGEQRRACDPCQELLSIVLGIVPHMGGQESAP